MNEYLYAFDFLSDRLRKAFEHYRYADSVNEIRLRRGLAFSLTEGTKNIYIDSSGRPSDIKEAIRCSDDDMEFARNRICEGSVYRHMTTILEGYIVTDRGLRVGVCGEGIYSAGRLTSVDRFNSVNIRIPHNVTGCSIELGERYRAHPASTLIYSPPGMGKTTFIRDLALELSRCFRVAVADEKCEIFPRLSNYASSGGMLDIFTGYRKAEAMEIATRTMSPELIICDEIGANDDTEAILSMQNSGCRLIATAHAEEKEDLMKKPNIKRLIDGGVFSLVVGLDRSRNKTSLKVCEL